MKEIILFIFVFGILANSNAQEYINPLSKGNDFFNQKSYIKASEQYEIAIPLIARDIGKNNIKFEKALLNNSIAYREMYKYNRSMELLAELLDLELSKENISHNKVLYLLSLVVDICLQSKSKSEAEIVCNFSMGYILENFGKDTKQTVMHLTNLAQKYLYNYEFEQAEKLYLLAYDVNIKIAESELLEEQIYLGLSSVYKGIGNEELANDFENKISKKKSKEDTEGNQIATPSKVEYVLSSGRSSIATSSNAKSLLDALKAIK